jgi:outer membrane protein OmpA-like peptidoglycan-associated protein
VFLPGLGTRPSVCALLAVVAATGGMGCGAPRAALTLRRVVLYQNGIGYFERSGEVRDPIYRLRLRSHEIDDVLKSLVVISETGSGEQRPVTAVIPQPRAARPSDAASANARGGTAAATAEDRSELLIDTGASSGDGGLGRPQRLTIAYTTPSPVWKSAYRIVLPSPRGAAAGDGSPAASAGDGVLQAWAIVDNLSGESWDGVELILATGAPLTFALDLRAPRFVPRPDISGQLVTPVATGLVLAEATRTSPVAATDSDRDGIPDSQDKCPNEPETYNGIEDSDGCPDRGRVIISQSSIQILDQLFFKRDSSKLEANTRPMIEAIAATLKGNPDLSLIEVAGHACGDSNPRDISQSRADAVRGALVGLGVEGRRLRARGYGGDQPLSAGTSEEVCGRNRRVQINILQRREEAPSPSPATAPGPVTAAHVAASARPLSTLQESLGGARYRLSGPVTLPEGSSTMVSLLTLRGAAKTSICFVPTGA